MSKSEINTKTLLTTKALLTSFGSCYAVSFLLVWACIAIALLIFFGKSIAQLFFMIGAVAFFPALILAVIIELFAEYHVKFVEFLSIFSFLSFCIELWINSLSLSSNSEALELFSTVLIAFPIALGGILFGIRLIFLMHKTKNIAKQD